MGVRFYQLVVDASDPLRLGHWWADVLGYQVLLEEPAEVIIGGAADQYPGICFVPVGDARVVKNRLHIDLDPDDYEAEVTRISELGARAVDIDQGDVPWTVFADPEGNEFCVLRPHTSLVA